MEEAAASCVEEGVMAALQQELLAVPGVAGADIADDHGVAGVRVQLAEGADASTVGVAVRRILREHGMRAAPGEQDGESGGPPPPPGAGSVVDFPLVGPRAEEMAAGVAERVRRPHGVTIEETANGIRLEVKAASGAHVIRTVANGGGGMDVALVAAVAELTGRTGVELVGVTDASFEGNRVLTVVLRSGESVTSGSAIQRGGRPYAMAQAIWRALAGNG
jgi:hypothetical protein